MNVERLAETFVDLADTLVDDFDLVDFLDTLVGRCAQLLDVSAAGLMFADAQGRLQVMASTSEEVRILELFQLQNDQGPCLECFRERSPVGESDLLTASERWPTFAPAALRAGFRSVHALPMRRRTETIGSLNLFHADARALQSFDLRIAQALVDVATIGLLQVEFGRRHDVVVAQLRTALDSRVLIEQAKGLLAERRRITTAEAFEVMRGLARSSNTRITEVARAVLDGSAFPAAPAGT